jgi:hypothetical protein
MTQQTDIDITENIIFIVKVKLFLFLTKHHAMKVYWGVEV